MATPKTPFRPRRSPPVMMSNRKSTPPVVGVVSRDSNDAESSHTTPQPSPFQPPAPQTRRQFVSDSASRGSNNNTNRQSEQADAQSIAESMPSLPEEPPPSPYSPPPESLWSEHTEDQWPYNHTKRQFKKVSHEDRDPPVSNKSIRQSWTDRNPAAAETRLDAQLDMPPPLPDVVTHQQYEADPRSVTRAAATPQRQSRVPPPSSSASRRFDPNLPTMPPPTPVSNLADDQALFLLQEEHKVLQNEYSQMEEHYRTICDGLQQSLAEKEEYMQQIMEALKGRDTLIKEYRETLESVPKSYKQEAVLQKQEYERNMQEQADRYEKLQADYNGLLQEKEELRSQVDNMQSTSKTQQESFDEHLRVLQEENSQLKQHQKPLKDKIDHYENEIVRQSKQIFELEEALTKASEEASNNMRSVQSESLARGNAWKAEKESLQQEIQTLREQLAQKDVDTAKLLDEQRRQQMGQIRDLERQVHYLTNTLAEWQGRHTELRATVGQHLQFKNTGSSVPTSDIACQTEECDDDAQDDRTSTTRSSSKRSTPSVRFVDTINVPQSTGTTPLSSTFFRDSSPSESARSFRDSSPGQTIFAQTSHSTGTPQSSQASVSQPTPSTVVSPWIPAYTGRTLHNRADPPPSCTSKSSRSQSPPGENHSTSQKSSSRRSTSSSPIPTGDEGSEDESEERLVDRVPQGVALEHSSRTQRATNRTSSSDNKITRTLIDDREGFTASVRDMVRSIVAGQQASAAHELLAERKSRESMEETIKALREELEMRKEAASVPNWQEEVNGLLEDIQKECNAAFERSKQRRTSPRSVLLHPIRKDEEDAGVSNDKDNIEEFEVDENWEINDTDNATASHLSLLDRDLSRLAETEELVFGL